LLVVFAHLSSQSVGVPGEVIGLHFGLIHLAGTHPFLADGMHELLVDGSSLGAMGEQLRFIGFCRLSMNRLFDVGVLDPAEGVGVAGDGPSPAGVLADLFVLLVVH